MKRHNEIVSIFPSYTLSDAVASDEMARVKTVRRKQVSPNTRTIKQRPDPIKVLLALNNRLYLDAIAAFLSSLDDVEVVATASDGRVALALSEKRNPSLAVMEWFLPSLNGLDLTRRLRASERNPRVILLADTHNPMWIAQAFEAGAQAYLHIKDEPLANVVSAIRNVASDNTYLSQRCMNLIPEGVRLLRLNDVASQLTVREREILQLIAEGKSTKEIAVLLSLSVKTVDHHRTNLMQKLGIHEVAGLTRFAIRLGIVQP